MREIKFRAWNTVFNVMGEVGAMNLITGSIAIKTTEVYQWASDEYVLMQYTGLKDKNGTEIYEGDIVRYDSTEFNKGVVSEVGSLEAAFDSDKLAYALQLPTIEVIGNIYENKDLLA